MWNVWKSESCPLKLMIVDMIEAIQNDGGTGNNRMVQTWDLHCINYKKNSKVGKWGQKKSTFPAHIDPKVPKFCTELPELPKTQINKNISQIQCVSRHSLCSLHSLHCLQVLQI